MRLLAAEPHSTTVFSFPLSVPLRIDFAYPVLDGVGLAGFRRGADAVLLA